MRINAALGWPFRVVLDLLLLYDGGLAGGEGELAKGGGEPVFLI